MKLLLVYDLAPRDGAAHLPSSLDLTRRSQFSALLSIVVVAEIIYVKTEKSWIFVILSIQNDKIAFESIEF